MKTNAPRGGPLLSPLRAARAEALAKWIRWENIVDREIGSLKMLDADAYAALRKLGWSRADVDRAIDDLVLAGRLRIHGNNGLLYLELFEALEPTESELKAADFARRIRLASRRGSR